jgi:predicted glycosyltransferase/nucleoside-diphosphate-sugar epimerase
MRSVITGVAGFIGSHLAEALLAQGEQVLGIDAFTPYYKPATKRANIAGPSGHPNFELLDGDLNEMDLDDVLRPGDVIYHLAGQPGVRASWGAGFADYSRHNIEATQCLLEAAVRRSVETVVFASSSSVYGDAPLPMAEDGPLMPVSPYGVTKRTAEELSLIYWRHFGLRVVPLRFFTVYGPRQRPDMAFNIFTRAALSGSPVLVNGEGTQRRDFTYVADVVKVLIAAAERGEPGRPVNVGGGSSVSVREALALIEEFTGRRLKIEYRAVLAGDARDTQAQTDRLRELGVGAFIPIAEGLRRQVAWQIESMGYREPAPRGAGSLARVADVRSPTVLLYSHDSYGLGHLRRNTAIAHSLLLHEPNARVVLLSGSPVANDWPLPDGVEVIRLPPVVKVGADRYEPAESGSMPGVKAERAGIINSALLRLRPDVFLVDHTPLGIHGELSLALQMAREQLPSTRVVIGLRDILDNPAAVRRAWKDKGIYDTLLDWYDQVLVYGARDLFDVTREYAFPRELAERTVFTGYIAKDSGLESDLDRLNSWSEERRVPERRILVMGGGGGDAGPLFRAFTKAWSVIQDEIPGEVILVLGPLMEPALVDTIRRRAAVLRGVKVVQASKSVLSLVAGADLVVSMGGYNSVIEVLTARKRLVICPRATPRTEQLIRARVMAGLGLARVVRLDREGSKALALAIGQALSEPAPRARVHLDGADRVAEILLAGAAEEETEAMPG